ncbi:MAG: hypothetical protein GY862_04930 [Gammaproteobacteria bacterium]|nr:hypothetical protein [Gammaproteobacteria bacterium]
MKISQELRQRIKDLEKEQERQHKDLTDLNQVLDYEAISKLESELVSINQQTRSAAQNSTAEMQDIDISLEKELLGQGDEAHIQEHEQIKDIDLSLESQEQSRNAPQKGYIVCLMFNKASPSEWSDEGGGGWRGKGLGTRYPKQQGAVKKMQELKKKWPDYPIEIFS